MGSKNKISDEELRVAANEVLKYELAIFDSYGDYPDHPFRGEFRLKMATLLHDAKRGTVKAAEYSMGFAFYAKRCIAAVLLIFTLTCIAMPETVMAGYQKLIEVIETVFEEYTEYRYRVNDVGGIEEKFRPLKLGYLPEGLKEENRIEKDKTIDLLYMDNEKGLFFNIYQRRFSQQDNVLYTDVLYTIDNAGINERDVIIGKYNATLIYDKNETRFFIFTKDGYVLGYTNLIESELKEIIKQMKI